MSKSSSRRTSVSFIILYSAIFCTESFPLPSAGVHRGCVVTSWSCQRAKCSVPPLLRVSEDDSLNDTHEEEPQPQSKKPMSNASRAGGRKPRPKKQDPEPKKKGPNLVVPGLLLVLFLSLKSLFGYDTNNPSYVYYQSSLFESTVVNQDGRRETSRQESFKSNIPELVKEQRRDGTTSKYLREADEDIERELNAAMEMQRRMLNDFFY